jgi:hypothetical protein
MPMSTDRRRRSSIAAVGALLVVLTSALGAWRVAAVTAPKPDARTVVVGDLRYSVTQVEQVQGLTSEDLSGMTHGVQSLVTNANALVTVSVIVTAGDSAATVDPGVLRVAVAGSSTGTEPVGSTLQGGELRAHASVEGAVSFVVARNGTRLVLRALGAAREVPLLTVDVATPEPSGAGHPHVDIPLPAATTSSPPRR